MSSLAEFEENVEELKREFRRLDEALKNEPSPYLSLYKISEWMNDINWNITPLPKATEFFLRQMIPKFINTLLRRNDFTDLDEGESTDYQVYSFFLEVIDLIVKSIQHDIVELYEALFKLFTVQATPFYMKYGKKDTITKDDSEEGKKLDLSSYYIGCVSAFGRKGGFDEIFARLNRVNPKIPLVCLRGLVKAIFKAKDGMDSNFLKKIIESLTTTSLTLILELTDEEFKNEDKKLINELTMQFRALCWQVIPVSKFNAQLETFKLALALKCFRSPYLEKRLHGLNDIKDFIGTVTRKDDNVRFADKRMPEMLMSSQGLVKWIRENKIMEQLYSQNLHPELIRRCVEIPRFLLYENEMPDEYLDLIWDASLGKHESIQHIIYNTISELAAYLSSTQIDYMYEKIKKIPYEAFSQPLLILVRTITNYGVQKAKSPSLYGLEIMWDLVQDRTTMVPYDITTQSLNFLCEFIAWPPCFGFRQHFLIECVKNLSANTSVPQSLKLLGKMLETFPPKKKKEPSILQTIDDTYHLLDLIFKDLEIYKARVREIVQSLNVTDPTVLNYTNWVGKYSHLQQIKDRIAFLDQILAVSPLTLSVAQVDIFWDCIIMNSLTADERDAGFKWLENARGQVQREEPFNDEVTQYILLNKVPQLDLSQLSVPGFDFFEYYFRYVNWKNGYFKQKANKYDYIVCSLELLAIDLLWNIALEAKDPVVGRNGIIVLNCLHKNLSAKLQPFMKKQREDFIKTCMQHLTQAAGQLSSNMLSNEDDIRANLRIDRCLTLIRTFMDEFETKAGVNSRRHGTATKGVPVTINVNILQGERFEVTVHSNDTIAALKQKLSERTGIKVNAMRIINQGKEIKLDNETVTEARLVNGGTIHLVKKMKIDDPVLEPSNQNKPVEEDSILPSQILSNPIYFNQLFQILTLGEEIGQKIWDLLMLLPTNQGILGSFESLKDDAIIPNWAELLDPQSTFKLLYSLQIVDSLIQNGSEIDKKEWGNRFVEKGGLKHLLSILMTNNFLEKGRGAKRGVCCALLLKIVSFLAQSNGAQIIQSWVDLTQFIDAMMSITYNIALQAQDLALNRNILTLEAEEDEIAHYATELLVAACVSNVLYFKHFLRTDLKNWFQTVLFASEPNIRKHVVSCITNLCAAIVPTAERAGLEWDELVAPNTALLNLLLDFIPTLDIYSTNCDHYFELLNKLLLIECAGGNSNNYAELFDILTNKIITHPIVEKRNSPLEDKVLIGYFDLAKTLVASNTQFKLKAKDIGLPEIIYWKCLFEIPSMNDHGALAPPKCKTKLSRMAAFGLLIELVKDCEDSYKTLTALLLEQQRGGEKRTQWYYQPAGYEKSPCGFVGLKNLGATCYMNSLMQQFYMIPALRYGIFSVNHPVEDKANNMLYQLQALFGNLQESEKKFYDTKPFCLAYKDNGQPMNPSSQMDADEFFNIFFDKLESEIKNSPQASILKRFFGGTIVNQIVSKECPHISEREESFFTLSLEVKNKKNIQESLDLYVQGDVLDGDNKYFCGQCSTKVDAVKRCCIKTLPNTLIVHLKRFEFDLETMRRIKLNDFCEFPSRFSMEPYTKEGLTRRDNPETEVEMLPAIEYEYELVGVLVHTGTAESGHYYSFIRDRNGERQWYSFNDDIVESFDPHEIPRACYGGFETYNQLDPQSNKMVQRYHARPNNAYMLFYEKVQPSISMTDVSITGTKQLPSQIVPADIYQSIWEENMNFLRDKNIFDTDYFAFIANIISQAKITHCDQYIHPSKMEFSPFMRAIELGTRFIVETLAHAKEKQNLKFYVEQLRERYSVYIPACVWLCDTLSQDSCSWLKQTLLVCTVPETRESFANLLIHVMTLIAPFERETFTKEETKLLEKANFQDANPDGMEVEQVNGIEAEQRSESLVIRIQNRLIELAKDASAHWRHFAQFFIPMAAFAKLGYIERQFFMSRSIITLLIDMYLGDESPLPSQHSKLTKKVKMGDKLNVPNVAHMLDLISVLIRGSTSNVHPEHGMPPSQLPGNATTISDSDRALAYSTSFFQKAIKEASNVPAMVEIATHLCWENEQMSRRLIDVICTGINNLEHDFFESHFRVFTALLELNDTLRAFRIDYGLTNYVHVIARNIKFKNATYHSIKYLVDLIPRLPDVRAKLFQHKSIFIETCLITASSSVIRCVVEDLFHNLIPEVPYPLPENYVIPPEGKHKLQTLYENLLQMLPTAAQYSRGDHEVKAAASEDPADSFRLCSYFRLLKWCAVGEVEKELFSPYAKEFTTLLFQIDSYQIECDENKKEITALWYHILKDTPENRHQLVSVEATANRMFDYFVSIKGSQKFFDYNNSALPDFYKVLLLCCENENFLKKLSAHSNFEWAVKYLLLSNDYPAVASVLYELVKKASVYTDFKQKVIALALSKEKLLHSARASLRVLDLLIQTPEDSEEFCKHFGLDLLSHFISVDRRNKDRTIDEKTMKIIRLAITILIKVTSCIINQPQTPKAEESGWENKQIVMWNLVQLIDYSMDDLATNTCFKLIENITSMDSYCYEKLIQDLCKEHEEMHLRKIQPSEPETSKKIRPRLGRIYTLIEEGPKDHEQIRYVDSYYHFVYRLCNIGIVKYQKLLPVVANLALYIAIETVEVNSVTSLVMALLNKLSENEHFKQNTLLSFYLLSVLTRHSHLLTNPDPAGLIPKLFGSVKTHLSPAVKSTIIESQASKITALKDDMVVEQRANEVLQILRVYQIILMDDGINEQLKSENQLLNFVGGLDVKELNNQNIPDVNFETLIQSLKSLLSQ